MDNGSIYVFGWNANGQLGLNDTNNRLTPVVVDALERIVVSEISCGGRQSIVVDTDGEVYTWGLNMRTNTNQLVPKKVQGLENIRITHVAATGKHSVALSNYSSLPPDMVPINVSNLALVNNEKFADVVFVVGDATINAHRVILTQRSAYFDTMFSSGMKESTTNDAIRIVGVREKVFLLLLEYIYVGTVTVPVKDACELFVAAARYDLAPGLCRICVRSLKNGLTVENVTVLLQSSCNNQCEELKDVCMRFVVAHYRQVANTEGFTQLHNDGKLLIEIMQEIAKQN